MQNKEELLPGGNAIAYIKLLPAVHISKNIKKGDAYTMLEGNRIIGNFVIKSIEEKIEEMEMEKIENNFFKMSKSFSLNRYYVVTKKNYAK